ncbi:MAG TPA: glycoside hydrolase family 36 protein, partial [Anaerolineae bacterium]
RGLQFVLNGKPLKDTTVEIARPDPPRIQLRIRSRHMAGTFGVDLYQDKPAALELRYWMSDLSADVIVDSFGIRFERIENLRAYLRNGYQSWDGSFYVEPEAMRDWEEYEARPETGFAMTQLLPRRGTGGLVAGFDRHDRFQHTFTFGTRTAPPSLMIQTLWDRKDRVSLPAASRLESERLILFEHAEIEEGLREWARLVAAASPTPPRLGEPITGWCSWYNLYGYATEENILEHLHVQQVARREQVPLRFFQIDDGFTPEMGDWLEVKPSFPRGMRPLLDDIRAAGLTPGLWIAPFMVGNRSRLYREHPDWVVQDVETGEPFAERRFYGEFRWHKRSEEYYILDTTHPDAFEYLRKVFRTWRREWGCEYFKTDFMYFGSEYGPDRVRYHTPGRTRIEIWRRVAEMIRAEIGDATWLNCGSPIWGVVGLADGVRIGRDVGVEWLGNLSAQSLLRDHATRNFANRILWQADPDCILLRERFHHLSNAELRSLAIYAGMGGGVVMTSDALDELSEERLRLWKLVHYAKPLSCRFPLLGQSPITYERLPADSYSHRVRHEPVADPVLVQVRGDEECSAVFVFNTGGLAVERTYTFAALGFSGPQYVVEWSMPTARGEKRESQAEWAASQPADRVSFTLAPHDSVLLFTSRSPIASLPERLP